MNDTAISDFRKRVKNTSPKKSPADYTAGLFILNLILVINRLLACE